MNELNDLTEIVKNAPYPSKTVEKILGVTKPVLQRLIGYIPPSTAAKGTGESHSYDQYTLLKLALLKHLNGIGFNRKKALEVVGYTDDEWIEVLDGFTRFLFINVYSAGKITYAVYSNITIELSTDEFIKKIEEDNLTTIIIPLHLIAKEVNEIIIQKCKRR